MAGFPDESVMPRSQDGSEPVRGGSIGLNRILSYWVDAAKKDKAPRFHAVLFSAFTMVRNICSSLKETPTLSLIEEGFGKDLTLFLDYFDEYLSHVWGRLSPVKFCPVVIYFPDYRHLPKEIIREHSAKSNDVHKVYQLFLNKHGEDDNNVRRLQHSRCATVLANKSVYPHQDVVSKFRTLAHHQDSLYVGGDPICLINHVPLDLHMAGRIRGINLLESYTGEVRKPEEFRLKLDSEGYMPFQSAPHVVLGDTVLIKKMVGPKLKKEILEAAERDRWMTRSSDDVRNRLSKITDIPVATLRKYNFV